MSPKTEEKLDENEIECPNCGEHVYFEVLACPKCGLRFYVDELEPSENGTGENTEPLRPAATARWIGDKMMPYASYRKWFGLLLVAASGLAYGLISQTINHLFMPGIPLYQPPFGAPGNIVLAVLIGASLGFLVASADTGVIGVLWGSLLGALFVAIATLLTGQTESDVLWRKIAAVVIIFVPVAAALAPMLILFRWAIGREEETYRNASKGYSSSRIHRYALPLGLVLVAGVLGLFSLYNDLARAVTPHMANLIQQGKLAGSVASLPAPLRPPDVRQFLEQKGSPYTLQWQKDDENQFAIPRPAGSTFDQSTVIARFETGYMLVCVFPDKTGQPSCKDFPIQDE